VTYLPIISLDLETTGLEPGKHVPWEIAWTTALHRYDDDGDHLIVHNERSFFLTLSQDAVIDPVALKVGGFMERYASATTPRLQWWAVQSELLADIAAIRLAAENGNGDNVNPATHFIGAVPQFDHAMLANWLSWSHRHWHYHLIDVETLAAGHLGIRAPIDTDVLTERLLPGYDSSRKHQAAADVAWNLALYAAVYSAEIVDADEVL
jgi:oligoribonuclease (3'-5' exoribonuclease)